MPFILIKIEHNFKKSIKFNFNVANPTLIFHFIFSTKGGNWNLIISLRWSVSDHENDICCRRHLSDETWREKKFFSYNLVPAKPTSVAKNSEIC